jgi:hypothetical protein
MGVAYASHEAFTCHCVSAHCLRISAVANIQSNCRKKTGSQREQSNSKKCHLWAVSLRRHNRGPSSGPAVWMPVQSHQGRHLAHRRATPVNKPVQIRYDASPICFKQGITDINGNPYPPIDQIGNLTLGNVQWEVGAISDLPHEYGIITYSGYAQPKTEQITINIELTVHRQTAYQSW